MGPKHACFLYVCFRGLTRVGGAWYGIFLIRQKPTLCTGLIKCEHIETLSCWQEVVTLKPLHLSRGKQLHQVINPLYPIIQKVSYRFSQEGIYFWLFLIKFSWSVSEQVAGDRKEAVSRFPGQTFPTTPPNQSLRFKCLDLIVFFFSIFCIKESIISKPTVIERVTE